MLTLEKILGMRFIIIISALLFLFAEQVEGQLSQGGRPMDAPFLKSRGTPLIAMPKIDKEVIERYLEVQESEQPQLKSFVFAHTFDVNISPANSGVWVKNYNGYDVWRVKLQSAEAYSLNVIFENFSLPEGARLFLYNEEEGHYLGAFTSFNNRESGVFAVSPVAGEELTIQYEVPSGAGFQQDFIITQVNHDFTGILKVNERRPTGTTAGACNVNVNCDVVGNWMNQVDAVCRIIINGREICSGVLMNNTAEDQRPYILSASHCYDSAELAEKSIFTFNFESPFCSSLDGDPSNSISGAEMKAFSDSLDFALVEMNNIPPPHFMPYYAGWDKSLTLPDSSVSIHHPQGGIKKFAIDRDAPSIADFTNDYSKNGFLRIHRWEEGVTEQGSSGGPLFNPSGNVIGTLTGGNATCRVPVNDYFSRFSLAWDYRADSTQQLKHWLDPLNRNRSFQAGRRFYIQEDLCRVVTNLEDSDSHSLVLINTDSGSSGYWGGTNNINISEIAERFIIVGGADIHGVSLGIGQLDLVNSGNNSEITIKIYNGKSSPESQIYAHSFGLGNMVENAMNYIDFNEIVETDDTFFVSVELSKLQQDEEFALYQSLREKGAANFFWYKQNNRWYEFFENNEEGLSIVNVISVLVCNLNAQDIIDPIVTDPLDAVIFPNPASGVFAFEAGQTITSDNVRVFNLNGQVVNAYFKRISDKKIQIDLANNLPGVYFVRFNSNLGSLTRKVLYYPDRN